MRNDGQGLANQGLYWTGSGEYDSVTQGPLTPFAATYDLPTFAYDPYKAMPQEWFEYAPAVLKAGSWLLGPGVGMGVNFLVDAAERYVVKGQSLGGSSVPFTGAAR